MVGQFTILRQSNTNLELITKQTEAQEWMQNVLGVQFPTEDFGKSIEDGTLLCRLANAIQPGIIKRINNGSTLKFKMIENITNFINACKTLKIPPIVIFHETDLYERRNMMKVVNCIHVIAEVAAKNGFQPRMEKFMPDDWTAQNTVANQNIAPSGGISPRRSRGMPPPREKKTVKISAIEAELGLDEDAMLAGSKISPRDNNKEAAEREAAKKKAEEDKKMQDQLRLAEEKLKAEAELQEIERQRQLEKEEKQRNDELKEKELAKQKEEERKAQEQKEAEAKRLEPQVAKSEEAQKAVEDAPDNNTRKWKKVAQEHPRRKSTSTESTPKVSSPPVEHPSSPPEETKPRSRKQSIADLFTRSKTKDDMEKKSKSMKKTRKSEYIYAENPPAEEPVSPPVNDKEKTRSFKSRSTSTTLKDLEKQYKGMSLSASLELKSSGSSGSEPKSLSSSTEESSPKQDPEDFTKMRSWKKRASISQTSSLASSGESPTGSPEYDYKKSGGDRSWNRRTGSLSMKDIEKYYKDLRSEATKMNSQEQIEDQIQKNKQELMEDLSKARVELRDAEGEGEDEGEEDKRERMRVEVLSEIMMSERYYVRDLELVINLFLRPVQNNDLLSREESEALFSNIELILKVNQEILNYMIQDFQMTKNIQLVNVGLLFLKMVDYLKIYSIYASGQAQSMSSYDKLKKEKKDFAQFLVNTEKRTECQGLNLLGYLIKPVQRICKYPLLFRELIKHTPRDHVDYPNIELCLSKVQEVAEYVNEKQRSAESIKKMVELQDNLVDPPKGFTIVAPSRKFIREGTFIKVNDRGKQQERVLFLFNDMLLYCKALFFKRATYQFKGVIPLDVALISDLPDTSDLQNCLQIVKLDDKRKYLLGAQNPAEKKIWLADLTKIMDQYLQREHDKSRAKTMPPISR
eukprot:TRINITY_DN4249_c0_g1_i1.p1 TRINITY_DN4249_c0_g1~~TRINITY_DN4249_c0_g1_i1.p1  ORF type:complete len:916 (+),score=312.20 TRINITY_DN4249_c0_g1_i1:107-2854(+)